MEWFFEKRVDGQWVRVDDDKTLQVGDVVRVTGGGQVSPPLIIYGGLQTVMDTGYPIYPMRPE